MHKTTKLLLALLMLTALTACSGSTSSPGTETNETTVMSTTDSQDADTADPEDHTSEPETVHITTTEPSETVESIEISTETDTTTESSATSETPQEFSAALLSVSAVTRNGRTVNYTINEEYALAYASVTYSSGYIPDSELSEASLSAEAENGSCSFNNGTQADLTETQYLTVTDQNGIQKTYSIVTERTEGKLPVVNIYLSSGKTISQIDRYDSIDMTISIDCSRSPEFSESLSTVSGTIRGRGNSTWKWAKKPYKIKLDEKAEVLGLPANRDWILLSNYADKSLMRCSVAYDMGRVMDNLDWTPTQYPVDLFINGQYQGVYSIGEHMEIAKDRVNVTKQSDDSEECGYLLEVGGVDSDVTTKGVHYFNVKSKMLMFIAFEYPTPEDITDAQKKEITEWFNNADSAIVSGGDIGEYIDIDSFCDWVIMQELTNNTDSAFRRSCFFTKDVGGKIKMGPIWDFDLAFGNLVVDNPYYNSWTIIGSDADDAYVSTSWGNYLMANQQFRTRLRERWFEVRDELLATAMESIDRYAEVIYPSQVENFKVWQIWDEKPGYSSWANFNANTYELQVQYLKDFLNKRAAWIDDNI